MIRPGERFNAFSHMFGASLALIGTIVLVVIGVQQHNPLKIVTFAIYGTMLVFLYLMSTLYHCFDGKAKLVFHKLDHVAIYLLIAGTYTPLTLVGIRGVWGWSLFGAVWGLAVIGILQDLLVRVKRRILPVVIYLLMGWAVVFAFGPLVRALSPAGLVWLITGGVFYSGGVVFYALSRKWQHGHAVWHVFVMFGSLAHYFSVYGSLAVLR